MEKRACAALLTLLLAMGMMDLAGLARPGEGLSYGPDTDLVLVDASFHGELAWDQMGNSTAIVGDVNGDGYSDILVGGESTYVDGPSQGKTHLILGKGSGWGTGINISSADSSFIGENPEDMSGFSVSGAGDVNGDGYDDFLIGAPFNPGGGNLRGKAYLFLGRPVGWPRNANISSADAAFIGERDIDLAGYTVSGAGDVNGDGYDDFLIGAFYGGEGGIARSKVYLLFGHPSGWSGTRVLSDADASFLDNKDISRFGIALADAGDVNGDGFDDFLIGAFNDDEGGGSSLTQTGAGQTYLVFGKASGWIKNASISTEAGASFIGEGPDDFSGYTVGGAGDVNGDGLSDIIIGSTRHSPLGPGGATIQNAGKVSLIFGNRSGWTMHKGLASADASFVGEEPYDALGNAIDISGDLDGNGYDDIVMAAFLRDGNGFSRGEVYVEPGSASVIGHDVNVSAAQASFMGEGDRDYAGWSASSGGDVNGDGVDDLVIGAPGGSGGSVEDGLVYVVFLTNNTWPGKVEGMKAYSDPQCSNETHNAFVGSEVHLELTGTDGDPTRMDTTLVNVTIGAGPSNWFWSRLRETGQSTGKYRGSFIVSDRTDRDRGAIGAKAGGLIDVRPLRDPSKATTLLVGFDNISVDGVLVSDNAPVQGASVNVTGMVANHGPREVRNITIELTEDRMNGTGPGTVFATRVVNIPGNGSANISVDWNTTGKLGGYNIRCLADRNDTFDEKDKGDNLGQAELTVLTSAVLSVNVERPVYEPLEEVALSITNSKGAERTMLSVKLPDGSLFLERETVPDAAGVATETFVLPLMGPLGMHRVSVSFEGAAVNTSFEVVNEPPLISSPDDLVFMEGSGGHNVSWSCSDMTPVSYRLTRDLEPLKEGGWDGDDITVAVDGLGLGPGNHSIMLQVTDLPGNTATDTVSIVVTPNLRPIITVHEPAQGTEVWGNVTVVGSASDPDGNVVELEARVDDGNWIPVQWNGTDDWTFVIDTDVLSKGQHIISIRATDDLGGPSELYLSIMVISRPEKKEAGGDGLKVSEPVVMTTAAVSIPAVVVLFAMAMTDLGRWTIFKLLFLAGYSKRKDDQVLDNFVRGWVQGVVVRDPGIRPVDVVSTFEGKYSANLVYYHINELIKFGYLYMVQRDRHGNIVRIRKGEEGRVVETDSASREEARTGLTMSPSKAGTMTLHLYPTDILAPKSQLNLRKRQRFQVYKYIAEHPGVGQQELSRALDMMRQAVAYHLKELLADGLLIIGHEGRKKYYYVDKEKTVELREDVNFPEEEGTGVPDRTL